VSDIHLDNWLNKADIDFYSMFIKTWIPFNAWYVKNFYDETTNTTSDRSLIDFVKQNDNPYKTKIKNLIQGASTESVLFKTYLKFLHEELENNSVPNEENRIRFSGINLFPNPVRQENITFNKRIYKFEFLHTLPKTSKRFRCTIFKNNAAQTTIAIIELHKCSMVELEQEVLYQQQEARVQDKIKNGFNSINPKKPVNIIKNNGIHINGTLYFENNIDLVSQVIIELIYQLRNKIFHGEINPNKNLSKTYEYGYLIQKQLISTLN